ncbi:prepilin-type N-terminal cleavage/methylation domain-containing protein [Desulfococcaceae bacterium HSG8]|nr:prepilin-type N-terminal cleavage/methylation domain-containing protein [Desulfococcaceae bacterium HSG8]
MKRKNEKGFTLIELMIVITIIAILAAIAIPNFLEYRKRGYNAQANADIKNFFTSCQAYFTDQPDECCTVEAAFSAGFKKSEDTVIEITGCFPSDFTLIIYHPDGNKTYTTDSSGNITGSEPD